MDVYDPLDTRARDEAEQESRQRAELRREQFVSDLKWMMSDTRGRRIASALLSRMGDDKTSFDTNAAAMAFKEGVRWVGLWFKSELKSNCPGRFNEMLKESEDGRRSNKHD